MDALLLALLLGFALDQGDRSQRLVAALRPAPLPVCLFVVAGAIVSALLGSAIAPHLPGSAGLLFFAIALALGAVGLLIPGEPAAESPATHMPPPGRLYGQLLLHRLADRSSLLLVGVAAMTANGWATALGGALGGLAALLPPLLAGGAYARAVPMRLIRPVLGGVLLLAGLGCAVGALGLV